MGAKAAVIGLLVLQLVLQGSFVIYLIWSRHEPINCSSRIEFIRYSLFYRSNFGA